MSGDDGARCGSEAPRGQAGSYGGGPGTWSLIEGTLHDGREVRDWMNVGDKRRAKAAFRDKHGWDRFVTVERIDIYHGSDPDRERTQVWRVSWRAGGESDE